MKNIKFLSFVTIVSTIFLTTQPACGEENIEQTYEKLGRQIQNLKETIINQEEAIKYVYCNLIQFKAILSSHKSVSLDRNKAYEDVVSDYEETIGQVLDLMSGVIDLNSLTINPYQQNVEAINILRRKYR